MKHSHTFVRVFFFFFSLLFMVGATLASQEEITLTSIGIGLTLGVLVGSFLLLLDLIFRRFHLLSFNTTLLGLFFGYLMGLALLAVFHTTLSLFPVPFRPEVLTGVQIALFLGALYLGVMMTVKASSELSFSLPFIKFSQCQPKTKEILLDVSALSDARVLDLAASGLLDGRLVIPRFLLKELFEGEESKEESLQTKAKGSIEIFRKLEAISELQIRTCETDFPEMKESFQKVLKLSRLLNSDVLVAGQGRIENGNNEGVRLINLHTLATALKPLMQRGEYLNIKIQRQGKEERQGVGYLEDGTMIVVNGGGDYIGKTIKACVLSVKHTQAGRMIFCNVTEEELKTA
jgi:uncharacterized protein YacL